MTLNIAFARKADSVCRMPYITYSFCTHALGPPNPESVISEPTYRWKI